MAERAAAERREPPVADREDQDHHDGQPEDRHRLAEGAEERAESVERRARPDRRADPERHRCQDGEQRRHRRERASVAGTRSSTSGSDGRVVAERPAELPVEDPAQKPDVLDGQGRVEAEGAPERLDLLRRRLGRQHEAHGVAGQVEQREDDEGDRHDDAERLDEAPEQVRRHAVDVPLPGRGGWRGVRSTGASHSPPAQRTPAFQRKISSPIVGFQSTFLLIPKSAAGW